MPTNDSELQAQARKILDAIALQLLRWRSQVFLTQRRWVLQIASQGVDNKSVNWRSQSAELAKDIGVDTQEHEKPTINA
ncbi:hypothetical protein [Nostoc sp. NMS8]|uniref:hypothetical protein n=1 Tax=Nostoc sp. NMS8 TaxID=2815392 RepID=UPI0025CF59D5|nr:hypothetical protein [Nostoc sp. NMS8]MBN3961947.1 hypothetical protein [Nostoc sp. NMS8]